MGPDTRELCGQADGTAISPVSSESSSSSSSAQSAFENAQTKPNN